MRSHRQIVAASDVDEIARTQGVSVHTVRSWAQRDSIPAEHWPAFVAAGIAELPELIAAVRPRGAARAPATPARASEAA